MPRSRPSPTGAQADARTLTYHAQRRVRLLAAARAFVEAVGPEATALGVWRIALFGSLATPKAAPKDLDLALWLTADALRPGPPGLAALARHGRRLGAAVAQAGSAGPGPRGGIGAADLFLLDPDGRHVGRLCPWRHCAPGRAPTTPPDRGDGCDAAHCGRVPHLHDDLAVVTLTPAALRAPPLDLWPDVVVRGALPADVHTHLAEPLRARGPLGAGAPPV